MSETATASKSSAAKNEAMKNDAETPTASGAAGQMPRTGFDLDAARAASGEGERNEVFVNLVTGDNDIVGLVAYSIYKQNKHDWLVSFNKRKSREPDEAELFAYIVGESTPRRLSTYRHLAEATLEGRGPKVTVGPATERLAQRSFANAQAAQTQSKSSGALAWIVGIAIAIGAVLLAGKYGIPGLR